MSWYIGNIEIKNRVVLAPMAGISNPAYMKICEEMGVGYAITELISAEAIVRGNQKTFDMLKGIDTLKTPIAIQIFGSNAQTMARAAQILVDLYPIQMIDINMGCPVPKVAIKAQAGSALLKNPDQIYDIVSSVSKAVSIPVTVKIRSGWDSNSINAIEVARIISKAGASAITVHARTRAMGYGGKADWNIIKQVKENVDIPVIGNGDVKTVQDIDNMLKQTGCDAVMIGRGLLGNPWLIRDYIDGIKPVTIEERVHMIEKHFQYLIDFKNEKSALLEMRTHIAYYLKSVPNASEIKNKIMKTKTKEEFLNVVKEVLK